MCAQTHTHTHNKTGTIMVGLAKMILRLPRCVVRKLAELEIVRGSGRQVLCMTIKYQLHMLRTYDEDIIRNCYKLQLNNLRVRIWQRN